MSDVRRVRLTVVQSHQPTSWEPDDSVPETRGDCPDISHAICPHYRCRYHLARIDACDRSGRPSLSSLPRDSRGWTMKQLGSLGDDRRTTLDPWIWMNADGTQKEQAFSCALQVVDVLGKRNNEQTGEVVNRHRTLIARELKAAVVSAVESGERYGISPEDLKATLIAMGEEAKQR
jgi:hypothetical protein